MDLTEALKELGEIQYEVTIMEPFHGRTGILKRIEGDIRYLAAFKVSGNIPGLLVKERKKELAEAKS